MTRAIVFDCETTGLDPSTNRIVSFAAIELVDRAPTGRFLHRFVNPGRDSEPGALRVHGLTTAFLSDKPPFEETVDDLLDFFEDSVPIAHNAQFDRAFVHAELRRAGRGGDFLRKPWECTKVFAQLKFGFRAGNRLDDLVKRFGIRDLRAELGYHGAFIDALLLTAVLGPLYGTGVVVDFESDLIRKMLDESGRPQTSSGAPEAQGPQEAIAGSAPAREGGAADEPVGDAAVHHAPEAGCTGPVGPAQGIAAGDRCTGGLTPEQAFESTRKRYSGALKELSK